MKRTAPVLFALALLGCGGGKAPLDHTIRVVYGDLPSPLVGHTDWDAEGHTTITLLHGVSGGAAAAVLQHEIWHAITHIDGHPNPPDCVSADPADLSADVPCPEEAAQMPEGEFDISFPDDPDYPAADHLHGLYPFADTALEFACAWWNYGLGRQIVFKVTD